MSTSLLLAMSFAWLLVGAPAASAHKAIVVVRHAEKQSETEPDPQLSLGGQDRALALSRLLRSTRPTTIFVSDKKRTQETAAPLAELLSMTPVVVPAADTAALVARLKALPKDAVAVVVAHSDTIPAILAGIGVVDKVTVRDNQYDRVFVVASDGSLLELRY